MLRLSFLSCLASLSALLACTTVQCAAGGREDQANVTGATSIRPFSLSTGTVAQNSIVVAFDPRREEGIDWSKLSCLDRSQLLTSPASTGFFTVQYLRDGVGRMTGQSLPISVTSRGEGMQQGIVLTTLALAPEEVRGDAEVIAALRDTGEDSYNSREAFFLKSEPSRLLVVANTVDGLAAGVVELLESVGYEVLGMGPAWTHVPDFRARPLQFSLRRAGRPGFYVRNLHAASGQHAGIGTLTQRDIRDVADEPVDVSYYDRWMMGTRMLTSSMPPFPGHALQAYHMAVLDEMRVRGTTQGFLTAATHLAPDAQRPPAGPGNAGWLWVNSDPAGRPESGKHFYSDGITWHHQLAGVSASLDVSVPFVRQLVLADMKRRALEHFRRFPGDIFVFATDPEDGPGLAENGSRMADRNWYPDYVAQNARALGAPYLLHGFSGINQPRETWDPDAASDTVYGFNNWLLWEFDKWLAALPAPQQYSAAGKPIKDMVRVSLFSYNYHDVPPHFNLDPRVRVMIAGYPKYRGTGEWKNVASQADVARAFRVLLPRQPSGDYRILSLAYYNDASAAGISGSASAREIHKTVQELYGSGVKALSAETDFNFGKRGLAYYLYAKMLWNPAMTVKELESLRTRWLQRAFGSGWSEMKAYYDFLTPEHYVINSPNNWAKAIRLLDAASQRVDPEKEPAARRRLDEVKQFWYFYYLTESASQRLPSPELREFVWKGQMSYMTAMFMVTQRFFNSDSAAQSAGPEFSAGRAHFTPQETADWWRRVLDFWRITPVTDFSETTLADQKPARSVDLNDLVMVEEFHDPASTPKTLDAPFFYNGGLMNEPSFLTLANRPGDEVGFALFWPWKRGDAFYHSREVHYGISWWNSTTKSWQELVDKGTTKAVSVPNAIAAARLGEEQQVLEVRYRAPAAGVYRVDVGQGGNLAQLASSAYDVGRGEFTGRRGQTFCANLEGLTQSPVYIYLPKGTKSLDMEVWRAGKNQLWFFDGLPCRGMRRTRVVGVDKPGTHRIALEPGEDGTIAILISDTFAIPYLYSVPMLWAKSSAALMVPRAVAEADGLTIVR